tara:strand:- start:3532 stop:4176 length:645 start_codon:yes stop_codon:yes gene_type:complete
MEFLMIFVIGSVLGHFSKRLINWLDINNYKLDKKNIICEFIGGLSSFWAFSNLDKPEAMVFILIVTSLISISIIDYQTFQVPLVFIFIGMVAIMIGLLYKVMYLSASLWGIFVGAVIPCAIMLLMWMITKRQGMGFGDIQMGIVLGAWLGPMRMAITLFSASILSLLAWIIVSLFDGFDMNRALPMGPFLSFAGIGVYIGSFYYPEFFHLLILI